MIQMDRFVAPTKKEAFAQAEAKYKKDFTLLGVKEIVKGGILGIGAKTHWEIRVMVSNPNAYAVSGRSLTHAKRAKDKAELSKHKPITPEEIKANLRSIHANMANAEREMPPMPGMHSIIRNANLPHASVNNVTTEKNNDALAHIKMQGIESEIQELKQLLYTVLERQREPEPAPLETNAMIIDDAYLETATMKTPPAEVVYQPTPRIPEQYQGAKEPDLAIGKTQADDLANETANEGSAPKRPESAAVDMTKIKDATIAVIEENLAKLRRRDFPEELLDDIRAYLLENSNARFYADDAVVKADIEDYFEKNLLLSKGVSLSGAKKKVVALVGPTGVGKTTTIPKLAALFRETRSDQRFITIDRYRIAAEEQLRRYAQILKAPFFTPKSPEEFREEILSAKTGALLFVDTIGRSHKNADEITATAAYLKSIGRIDADVQLVISATTKYYDAIDILENFKPLNYNGIIITKMDETDYVAPALSAAIKMNTPISYFTFGQSVPKDICEAAEWKKNVIAKIYGA